MVASIYRPLIMKLAHKGMDPLLIEAQVWVESGSNPWAWNPEVKYKYLWNVKTNAPFRALKAFEDAGHVPADFPTLGGDRDQEFWGQQASWGLLQIMGAVAREVGFTGVYLTALCDPTTGLIYALKHLAALLQWAQGDESKALAAYNGGRAFGAPSAAYAAKVLALKAQLPKV